MSAIIASYSTRPLAKRAQEQFVSEGLNRMSGRAPGDQEVFRGDDTTVVGHKTSRPLAAGSWGARGVAHQRINGKTVALAISGYIDNADEIANSLDENEESCSHCVAVLLLKAYLSRGKGFVEAVGGSFSIVIRDGRTDEVHLIRDRLGIEPLYFWCSARSETIIAASEPKGVIYDPDFPRVFDGSALLDLFNSTSRIPGTTVYKYLRETRPGEIISFREGVLRSVRYWGLPVRCGDAAGSAEAAEVIHELLSESIGRRVSGPDPSRAFLLSGGLDSSIICAVANSAYNGEARLPTYSFSYPEEESNFEADALHLSPDGPYVRIMQEALGSDHENIIITQDDFAGALERTVLARDLPGVGDLDVTLLWLFESIKARGRDEVFSGEGADDLFGGFPWFKSEASEPGHTFPWLKGTNAGKFLDADIRAHYDPDAQLRKRWSMAATELPHLFGTDPFQSHMDRVFYMQLTRFLPFLLDRVDRMSAAAGIRPQLPFVDHRLVEYAWQLNYRTKTDGEMEKGILRKAFSGQLPEEVAWRRKSGFAVTKSRGYVESVIGYLREAFEDRNSLITSLLDVTYLRKFMDGLEWSDGQFSAPPILPRIMMLDMWVRAYEMDFQPE